MIVFEIMIMTGRKCMIGNTNQVNKIDFGRAKRIFCTEKFRATGQKFKS